MKRLKLLQGMAERPGDHHMVIAAVLGTSVVGKEGLLAREER